MLNRIKIPLLISLLKSLAYIGLIIGRVLIWLRNNDRIDLEKIKKITLNRADRWWDAILTRPWIECLLKWLEANGYNGDIEIIASPYNLWILEPLRSHPRVTITIWDKPLNDYEVRIFALIRRHLWYCISAVGALFKKPNTEHIFVNLMGSGDMSCVIDAIKTGNPFVIGSNTFLSTIVNNFSLQESYLHFTDKNLTDSYTALLEQFFPTLPKLSATIRDHRDLFYPADNHQKSGILLCTGVKIFRNISRESWLTIVTRTAEKFPNSAITILDDTSNYIADFLSTTDLPQNVTIQGAFPNIRDFIEFSQKFEIIIGVDGGGINLIRHLTHSLTIFTTWNSYVWSPWRWEAHRIQRAGMNNWFLDITEPIEWRMLAHAYKKTLYLPAFNIPLNTLSIFDNFDESLIINFIDAVLQSR